MFIAFHHASLLPFVRYAFGYAVPTSIRRTRVMFLGFARCRRIPLLVKFYRYLDDKGYDGDRIYQDVLTIKRTVSCLIRLFDDE